MLDSRSNSLATPLKNPNASPCFGAFNGDRLVYAILALSLDPPFSLHHLTVAVCRMSMCCHTNRGYTTGYQGMCHTVASDEITWQLLVITASYHPFYKKVFSEGARHHGTAHFKIMCRYACPTV
jgi:hypothetical protein